MISAKSIIINRLSYLKNVNFKIITSENYPEHYINNSYIKLLNNIKNDVCRYENWYIYRKLFTSLLFLNYYHNKKNIGIFKKNVLSRSYFKMIEIHNDYNICKMNKNNIKVAFIAEAPGGFIEAFYKIRNKYNDSYYGISLIEENKNNIPTWYNLEKKMKYKTNLNILYGKKNNGNIYELINIFNIVNTIGKNSCDIVTADGGFDFTTDFINQEYNFTRLFICEIVLALSLQKLGGNFVIKCFDLTNILSLKIFYILCHHYEKVIISKLHTSRKTNSERYIICKNLQSYIEPAIIKNLYNVILKWDINIKNNMKLIDIFDFNLNSEFLKKLEIYNSWFFEKQLDIYNYIININNNLSNNIINNIIKQIILENIEKCMAFCKLNNIFINYQSYFIITDINSIINTHFILDK
jgi:23S rRNA U2552 (ribose-2'-O)-methylase RlmE/FtsJ